MFSIIHEQIRKNTSSRIMIGQKNHTVYELIFVGHLARIRSTVYALALDTRQKKKTIFISFAFPTDGCTVLTAIVS